MLLPSLAILLLLLAGLVLSILIVRAVPRASRAPAFERMWPTVSIIVPAMNEEGTIEPAMRSLLALDYPHYEIIAVNDRSTDSTGRILDRLAIESNGRLRVTHIETLPERWLGKCHALARATETARGSWLLFTDADVVLAPDALRLAVAWGEGEASDHVVLFPQLLWHSRMEAAILTIFAMLYTFGFQTWRVRSRSRNGYVGVGAFNMVRRSVYDRFGGHEPLRMEIADDVKLGYLVKTVEGRSLAVASEGTVRVRWREGALDTVRGIERSGFAGVGFAWWKVVGLELFCSAILLGPFILPWAAPTALMFAVNGTSILIILLTYTLHARLHGLPPWIGVLHPVATLLLMWAFLRSAIVTTVRGGVGWRTTFYTIDELKQGSVP